ncbi:MAG TPA: carbohydrate ABC transporter permease, partial [Aequorivita sp.]|nr:carbohydrate ABC transporter permease [Aequorivita sp.]
MPKSFQWNNYIRVWVDGKLGKYIINSFFITIVSVFLVTFFSLLAGYPLARFNFKGRDFLYGLFIAGMMFPVFLGLVPLFFLLDSLRILDTHTGLIFVCIGYGIPFGVFILHSFFLTIPSELEESAVIDGCSQFKLFFKVMMPLAKPGIVTMIIFQSIR